jgi:hypothetical protein
MSTIGPIYGREFAGTFGRAARLVASASLSVLEAGAHWRSAPNSGHSQRPSSVCRPIDACAPISQIKCFGTVISALQQQPSLQQMSRPCASRRAGNELRHRGAPGMTGPFSNSVRPRGLLFPDLRHSHQSNDIGNNRRKHLSRADKNCLRKRDSIRLASRRPDTSRPLLHAQRRSRRRSEGLRVVRRVRTPLAAPTRDILGSWDRWN